MSASLPTHLQGLASAFGKDLAGESQLEALNKTLAPVEREIEASFSSPQNAPVFILGAPRSGTTLMSQLMTASRAFGIVRTGASRFWLAPALAMMIERVMLRDDAEPTYRSQRGSTEGEGDPAEFGYFWSLYFDLGQDCHALTPEGRAAFDRTGLRRAVAAMEAAHGKPMAFKNNTWFSFHADLLAEVFPGCVLVHCTRDLFFIAQSIWLQRLDLYGTPETWWSMRPPDYAEIAKRPPIEQVAWQAASIERETRAALSRVRGGATIIEAPYQRLTSEPRALIGTILEAAGLDPAAADALPNSFEATDRSRLSPEITASLADAVTRAKAAYGLA